MIVDPEHNGDDWEPVARCDRCTWQPWETLVWLYTGLAVVLIVLMMVTNG